MRSKVTVYESSSSHTHHMGLSLDAIAAIAATDFDDIPDAINGVTIFEDGFFWPPQSEYNGDRKWICRPSGWCEHKRTGLKVRYTENASPNYHDVNGNGTRTAKLEVMEPRR